MHHHIWFISRSQALSDLSSVRKAQSLGAEEMVHWLKVCTALAEDLSLGSQRPYQTAPCCRQLQFQAIQRPLLAPLSTCTHTCTYTDIKHNLKKRMK